MDRLYPLFIWQRLPPGIAGLVMAAILAAAMSN
jgi:Na+/proline symporter